MSEDTKLAADDPGDQSFMVDKYILFFEDGMPRDTLFIEKSVYLVNGLKGTKILLLEWRKTSPGATEYKKRERCHPGGHIAVITDSLVKATQVIEIVTNLQASVDKLADFATNAIKGLALQLTAADSPSPSIPPPIPPPAEAIRVRTRTRT